MNRWACDHGNQDSNSINNVRLFTSRERFENVQTRRASANSCLFIIIIKKHNKCVSVNEELLFYMYSPTGPVKAAANANQQERFLYPLSLNTLLLIYLFLWVLVFVFQVMNLRLICLTCSVAFASQNKFCDCFSLPDRNHLRSICRLAERGRCVPAGCASSSCPRVTWLSRSWLLSSGWIRWARWETFHTSKWGVNSGYVCVFWCPLLSQEV